MVRSAPSLIMRSAFSAAPDVVSYGCVPAAAVDDRLAAILVDDGSRFVHQARHVVHRALDVPMYRGTMW